MDALAGVDVLDFNNPAAPTADSVDGVYAEPAVADEPRHHYLSHWLYPLFSSLAKEALLTQPFGAPLHFCISLILTSLRRNAHAATNW
jgi:hypothetical protein